MVEAVGAPIVEYFAALKDPRIDRSKRHNLLDIGTIAICGTICGADNWVDIELFGKCKPESTEGGRRVSVLKRQEGAPVLLG